MSYEFDHEQAKKRKNSESEYMLDVEISKLLGLNNGRVGILVSSHEKTLDKDFRYLYQYVTNEYSDVPLKRPPESLNAPPPVRFGCR